MMKNRLNYSQISKKGRDLKVAPVIKLSLAPPVQSSRVTTVPVEAIDYV